LPEFRQLPFTISFIMIDASESVIQSVSVHHVGNASLEEPVKLS